MYGILNDLQSWMSIAESIVSWHPDRNKMFLFALAGLSPVVKIAWGASCCQKGEVIDIVFYSILSASTIWTISKIRGISQYLAGFDSTGYPVSGMKSRNVTELLYSERGFFSLSLPLFWYFWESRGCGLQRKIAIRTTVERFRRRNHGIS